MRLHERTDFLIREEHVAMSDGVKRYTRSVIQKPFGKRITYRFSE